MNTILCWLGLATTGVLVVAILILATWPSRDARIRALEQECAELKNALCLMDRKNEW